MSNDNMALLAAASYANFKDTKNTESIQDALKNEKISATQAEKFTDTYEILAHQSNTASGYSGTIVKNRQTNEIFVLHRGTEVWSRDLGVDGLLVLTGLPGQQAEDAKRFVDNAIQRGIIKSEFTNVGHSLGKALADVVHFTTNLSKGSVGFNGPGISLRKIPEIYRRYPTPILTTPPLDPVSENEKFLERLAKQGGNTFRIKEKSTINYVSNGVRIIPNDIVYNQYGKVTNIDIGITAHSINLFIDQVNNINKLAEKYNLEFQDAIQYYHIIRKNAYYHTPTLASDLSFRYNTSNIDKIIDYYISENSSISTSALNKFMQKSYITDRIIATNFDPTYWQNYGDNVIGKRNKKTINKIDFTNKPVADKNSNNDAVSLSHALYAMVDKDKLNKFNDPVSVSSSHIITNGFQPANHNIAHRAFSIKDMSEFSSLKVHPSLLNRIRGIGYAQDPVDPLILDLNGDGARAVSYTEKPVLFDIDNDGGSLEETGWVNNQDGLLVRDLNNNGKIDNISEVFSEYYAGRAGRNGESGEKPFANGFEALKSLDSNKDNVFDSKDRDFNAVHVWQDANHNGVTDKGELKTLKQLGITAIKLDYEEKGGQLFNGNELLAKGSFTRNGKQQEVVAVNFLANPRGHRISNANGGKKTVTEATANHLK